MRSIQTSGLLLLILIGCTSINDAPAGVKRQSNPDLIHTARELGFELAPVSRGERSLTGEKRPLRSVVLLRNNDRVTAVFWYPGMSAERDMQRVTAQMFNLFSPDIANLVDDTVHREGFVPIDVLAFTDPAVSHERILFARIRDHLYEFHIAEGGERWVRGVLLAIARE